MGTLNFAGGAALSGSGTNLTTASGLDFGSAEWVNGAPGTILKVSYGEGTTQLSTTTTNTYQVIHSVSHTAVAPNSRYFLTGYSHAYNANADSRANLGFSVTIGGTTTRIEGVDGSTGDTWGTNTYPGAQLNRSTVYTSTAAPGTALTFNLLGAGWDDTAMRFNYTGYGHVSTLTVMEIAA